MKRRRITIAVDGIVRGGRSMAYAKEIETTTEDDEAYDTLEVNENHTISRK